MSEILFCSVFLKSSRLVIGNTKEFIHGSALSHEGHIHDERYYTESEMDNLLNNKANTNHTHSGYATTTIVNALTTRVTSLEGSVDMSKLVYTACLSISARSNSITFADADFVRAKCGIFGATGDSFGVNTYFDIYKGCSIVSAYLNTSPTARNVSIAYSANGVVSVIEDYKSGSAFGGYVILEFYKQ